MKKLFTLAAIALFTMTSCSDDDATSTTPDTTTDGPLVTSFIETMDGVPNTYTVTYDGNKVIKIQDQQGYVSNLTYTNNQLVKEEDYYDGEFSEYNHYSYSTDGKLAQVVNGQLYDDTTWDVTKTTYTYNSNGTVSTLVYTGDETAQTTLKGAGTVTYTNGNLTGYSFLPAGSTTPVVKTLTYSDKNDAFKNVFGNEFTSLAYLEGGPNTMLSINDGDSGYSATYTYQYNADNYPVSEVENWDGDIITTQYFYNN
ncbi:hypothetical protein [Flavobacterium subsaxonicum]|uniref:DUF4595 domain-containing protein n=1 Tax=Flavobacterium subsaxonicum WB 4.1-42 = DSM 21790 TaxID=1121898 RepID=A0A0A2MS45_9FLAO|nr:hypothetical protein [Flavobacterium subsaxonicum]KGO94263.1 hypothetical protein Q766_04890 [Flavobacterium subsaxonicum WB 4.1-42 = DSM 21790]